MLYGEPVAYVRGKMVKQKVSRAKFSEDRKSTDRAQVMYSDVMSIDKRLALISVCDPLQLTLFTLIKTQKEQDLGYVLQGHIHDPHALFLKLRRQVPGVLMDVGGGKDFVHKVDAKIRRIKETYRSVCHPLSCSQG